MSLPEKVVERHFRLDVIPIAVVPESIRSNNRDMNRPLLADDFPERLNTVSNPDCFILLDRIFAFGIFHLA